MNPAILIPSTITRVRREEGGGKREEGSYRLTILKFCICLIWVVRIWVSEFGYLETNRNTNTQISNDNQLEEEGCTVEKIYGQRRGRRKSRKICGVTCRQYDKGTQSPGS